MMKKVLYYFLLALTVTAALVLLGAAVGFAVLRPYHNYYFAPRTLPDMSFPDHLFSAAFLILAAFVCFAGSLLIRLLQYDDQKEGS